MNKKYMICFEFPIRLSPPYYPPFVKGDVFTQFHNLPLAKGEMPKRAEGVAFLASVRDEIVLNNSLSAIILTTFTLLVYIKILIARIQCWCLFWYFKQIYIDINLAYVKGCKVAFFNFSG